MRIKRGWYRSNNQAEEIYPCPQGADACIGGRPWDGFDVDERTRFGANATTLAPWSAGQELCASGYEGQLCGTCSSHFFRDAIDRTCLSCSSERAAEWYVYATAVIVCVFVAEGLFTLYKRWKDAKAKRIRKRLKKSSNWHSRDWQVYKDNLITVGFTFQIICQTASINDMRGGSHMPVREPRPPPTPPVHHFS